MRTAGPVPGLVGLLDPATRNGLAVPLALIGRAWRLAGMGGGTHGSGFRGRIPPDDGIDAGEFARRSDRNGGLHAGGGGGRCAIRIGDA